MLTWTTHKKPPIKQMDTRLPTLTGAIPRATLAGVGAAAATAANGRTTEKTTGREIGGSEGLSVGVCLWGGRCVKWSKQTNKKIEKKGSC